MNIVNGTSLLLLLVNSEKEREKSNTEATGERGRSNKNSSKLIAE
jgi:hypothetical protein